MPLCRTNLSSAGTEPQRPLDKKHLCLPGCAVIQRRAVLLPIHAFILLIHAWEKLQHKLSIAFSQR